MSASVTRAEFAEKFPMLVPAHTIGGITTGTLTVDRDASVSGIVNGDLVVRKGAHVLVHGIVEGTVSIEAGAVAYVSGIVKTNVYVHGAACISGIVGNVIAGDAAVICVEPGTIAREARER